MTRHRFRCPMRWGDMDAQDHVNNASYLDYLQEARIDFLLTGPPPMRELLASGVLVVSHAVEYLAPVRYAEEPLTIELWVSAAGASRFAIDYEVFAGELVARARTGAAPYDLATAQLRRLRPDERSYLEVHREDAVALRSLPSTRVSEPAHRYPLRVRWSDLDSYGHANNVKYFDYVQEARIALIRETLGWTAEDVWALARQDLEYRKPLDFRLTPYEVRTSVADVGTRSLTLAVELCDPADGTPYATARSVVVGSRPIRAEERAALARYGTTGN